jgi:hypothetical protein
MTPSDDNEYTQELELLELLAAEEAEAEEDIIYYSLIGAAFICYGAEEARRLASERRLQHRLYLVRSDLLPDPRADTPWQALYDSQNDRAFITTMGFDVNAFHYILHSGFAAAWNSRPIPRSDVAPNAEPLPGRRSLDAAGGLGLILHYLNSTMHDVSLMQIFALVPSTVSRYLSFALQILLELLRRLPEGQIQWPTGDEFAELNDLVIKRHPLLDGAFGVMDGLNLPVQTSADIEIENATYNGWLHAHFVSCVIAFSSAGTIFRLLVYPLLRSIQVSSLHAD